MLEKLGGRKFLFAVFALLLGTTCAVYGKLDQSLTALILGLVGSFHASNTILTHKSMQIDADTAGADDSPEGEVPSAVDMAVQTALDGHGEILNQIAMSVHQTGQLLAAAAAQQNTQR